MDNKTKKILWGGGLIALGIIVYKLVFKKETSQVQGGGGGQTNNGFPIYSNPLCNDGEAGGCEYDQRVEKLQEYLNGEGYDVEEDGLFGDETALALEDYLDGLPEAEYTALGYNYVENSNYITLAFYNDHLP